MGFEGDVRESGREASAAFPSQQVLVFGPGETASIGPVGWSSGLEACAAFPSQQVLVFGPVETASVNHWEQVSASQRTRGR